MQMKMMSEKITLIKYIAIYVFYFSVFLSRYFLVIYKPKMQIIIM